MQLILVSGLSGSGKSIALNVLEDSGFYCVDNLPAKLLPEVVSFLGSGGPRERRGQHRRAQRRHAAQVPRTTSPPSATRASTCGCLFLEAKTDTLVKRFSETRRRHPLSDGALTLTECIEREREMLAEVASARTASTPAISARPRSATWVKDFVQPGSIAAHAAVPVLRLQARHPARCRPRVRRALPAQSPLRPRAAPLTGKDAARDRRSSRRRARQPSCSRTSAASSSAGCRPTRRTTAVT